MFYSISTTQKLYKICLSSNYSRLPIQSVFLLSLNFFLTSAVKDDLSKGSGIFQIFWLLFSSLEFPWPWSRYEQWLQDLFEALSRRSGRNCQRPGWGRGLRLLHLSCQTCQIKSSSQSSQKYGASLVNSETCFHW